jgi:hypothetical protein
MFHLLLGLGLGVRCRCVCAPGVCVCLCVLAGCAPDCANKNCGPDGCGGFCGGLTGLCPNMNPTFCTEDQICAWGRVTLRLPRTHTAHPPALSLPHLLPAPSVLARRESTRRFCPGRAGFRGVGWGAVRVGHAG